jgi:hypothetical protein
MRSFYHKKGLTKFMKNYIVLTRYFANNMSGPDTQESTKNYLSQIFHKISTLYVDFSIIQPDLQQTPADVWDLEPTYILGKFSGPPQNVMSAEFLIGESKQKTLYDRKQTQFVLVLYPGDIFHLERYNPGHHKIPWNDIKSIGELTVMEFVNQLEGFGTEIIPMNQQFENTRKSGSARKKSWPPRLHPPVKTVNK